jgi:hypothetical protein
MVSAEPRSSLLIGCAFRESGMARLTFKRTGRSRHSSESAAGAEQNVGVLVDDALAIATSASLTRVESRCQALLLSPSRTFLSSLGWDRCQGPTKLICRATLFQVPSKRIRVSVNRAGWSLNSVFPAGFTAYPVIFGRLVTTAAEP